MSILFHRPPPISGVDTLIAARDQQFLPTEHLREPPSSDSMGARSCATWPAGKWVHPALLDASTKEKPRVTTCGNPTHPCGIIPR